MPQTDLCRQALQTAPPLLALLLLLLWGIFNPARAENIPYFVIGAKTYDTSQYNCGGQPGCYIKEYECKWDVTRCYRQCEKEEPWNDDVEKCETTCMKNSSTMAAYQGYRDIQDSVIESFCLQYTGDKAATQ